MDPESYPYPFSSKFGYKPKRIKDKNKQTNEINDFYSHNIYICLNLMHKISCGKISYRTKLEEL